MQTLIADQTLPEKLDKVSEPVTIRSPAGRFLGVFTPTRIPPELEIEITEELLRKLDDPDTKWVSAAEVEARLRAI